MKAPHQCALWRNAELTKEPDSFDVPRDFADETHCTRHLFRYRECGLYVDDFYEEINWDGDDDLQYANLRSG